MKDWEVVADNLKKPVGAWAGSQPLILKGERSGLLMRIATTEGGLSRVRMRS
jgi:hypothetical protein